eukprot:5024002-Prymnesium_polylepis.1
MPATLASRPATRRGLDRRWRPGDVRSITSTGLGGGDGASEPRAGHRDVTRDVTRRRTEREVGGHLDVRR